MRLSYHVWFVSSYGFGIDSASFLLFHTVWNSHHREIPRDFLDSKAANVKNTKQNRGVKLTCVNIRRAQRNKP